MMLNLQAKVRAAEYEAESIKAAALPQVNWVVSKSTAKDSNGNESGWYTGLNVEWEAFSGGSQRAAQMTARAKANVAQQQYEVSYRDRSIKSTIRCRSVIRHSCAPMTTIVSQAKQTACVRCSTSSGITRANERCLTF